MHYAAPRDQLVISALLTHCVDPFAHRRELPANQLGWVLVCGHWTGQEESLRGLSALAVASRLCRRVVGWHLCHRCNRHVICLPELAADMPIVAWFRSEFDYVVPTCRHCNDLHGSSGDSG